MLLQDYRPRTALVTKITEVDRPRFPVIDAHNHLAVSFGHDWENRPASELVDEMDKSDIKLYVDLDGGWGEDILYRHLDYFKGYAPDRFLVFGGVDWYRWPEMGSRFGDWAAASLRDQVARGADGLKIWKNFGLHVCDPGGALAAVDDTRLDPIWETAAELNVPVTIHVADPAAFFWPLDNYNERYEELSDHPDWHVPSPPYPTFESLVSGLASLVERHPRTIFIGAHVGCYAENLKWVGEVMDRCPNFYVDISARLGELCRQPYAARKFFIQYADRILFGTDLGPDPLQYRKYYRFLETDDEYFNYSVEEIPQEGRWGGYGIFLPDDVLKKVYYSNAEKIMMREGR